MTQYIGAKYVPSFEGAWESGKAYDSLCCVTDSYGNTWVSKKPVPSDAPLVEGQYWIKAFDFNAQVEQYQQAVETAVREVKSGEQTFYDNVETQVQEVKSGEQTFYDNVVQENDAFQKDINRQMGDYQTTVNNTVNQYKQDIDNSESAYKAEIDQSEAAFTNEINGKYNAQQNQINQLVLQAGSPEPTSAEIAAARGVFATLADRLNEGVVNVNNMFFDGYIPPVGELYNVQSSKVWLYDKSMYNRVVEEHQSDGYFPTALTAEKWGEANKAWIVVVTRQRIEATTAVKTGIIWIFADNFSYVYTRQYKDDGTIRFVGEWTERGENDLSDLQAAVTALQGEIVNARDTYPTLDARIDNITSRIPSTILDSIDLDNTDINSMIGKTILAYRVIDTIGAAIPTVNVMLTLDRDIIDITNTKWYHSVIFVVTTVSTDNEIIQTIKRVGTGPNEYVRIYNKTAEEWIIHPTSASIDTYSDAAIFNTVAGPYGGKIVFNNLYGVYYFSYNLNSDTKNPDIEYLPTIPEVGDTVAADYMILVEHLPLVGNAGSCFMVFRAPSRLDSSKQRFALGRFLFRRPSDNKSMYLSLSTILYKDTDFDSEHCITILPMGITPLPYRYN